MMNWFSLFCKFGEVVVSGSFLQPGIGKCTVPPSMEYSVRVSLSFDGENYSNSDIFLRYNQKEKKEMEINWISIIATAMVFTWCSILVSQWSKNPTGNKKIAQQMQIQQNEHQIHAFDQNNDERKSKMNAQMFD